MLLTREVTGGIMLVWEWKRDGVLQLALISFRLIIYYVYHLNAIKKWTERSAFLLGWNIFSE